MLCVHLTESRNLNSIKKIGLIPCKPYLDNHEQLFKRRLKSSKVVYLTLCNGKKRTAKFLKDFVYFQIWGKPRNMWIGNNRDHAEDIYKKQFNLEFKEFTILICQFNPEKSGRYLRSFHTQDKTLWGLNDIDERFSHTEKELIITPRKIEPDRINEIGRAFPVIRNNNISDVKLEG